MSIALELSRRGKAGNVCPRSYRNGPGCPLIVRQTSEDVLTANVFGILKHLHPALWALPLLRYAFSESDHFKRPIDEVQVILWHPVAPPSDCTVREGPTEVDVFLRLDEVTVFIESKYRSELSKRTTYHPKRDQLVRLLDVCYEDTISGHLYRREPYVLVLGLSDAEPPLVTRYRNALRLKQALAQTKSTTIVDAMATMLSKRVGYVSWQHVATLLDASRAFATDLEASLLSEVRDYLRYKVQLPYGQTASPEPCHTTLFDSFASSTENPSRSFSKTETPPCIKETDTI